jgi:hypothetical protein
MTATPDLVHLFLSSPALMGGPATLVTKEKGQLLFPVSGFRRAAKQPWS